MQDGLVARKVSVRLSVCLSVKRVDCDKTEEKYIQILYCTKDHLALCQDPSRADPWPGRILAEVRVSYR